MQKHNLHYWKLYFYNTSITQITQLKVYPNPVLSLLNISIPNGLGTMVLADVTGKSLEQFKINSANFQLDMSHYNPGLYFISVMGNNGISYAKIIKE